MLWFDIILFVGRWDKKGIKLSLRYYDAYTFIILGHVIFNHLADGFEITMHSSISVKEDEKFSFFFSFWKDGRWELFKCANVAITQARMDKRW